MPSSNSIVKGISQGNFKSIARGITIIENSLSKGIGLLQKLSINNQIPVIGVTGPPGAGKSSLVNALLTELLTSNHKVAVLAVDPSSPFNLGALLGDRVRLTQHFNNTNLYIRSIATRGSLGGLSPKILETIDLLKAAGFNYIFVETVGVGQSEIEIAGVADTTVVVMVPESGDEVQTMKAGLMEIADIFVVNKADRPGANTMAKNLSAITHANHLSTPVLKTVATKGEGIQEVLLAINNLKSSENYRNRKTYLMLDKVLRIIQTYKMNDINKQKLRLLIEQEYAKGNFNLYQFINQFL